MYTVARSVISAQASNSVNGGVAYLAVIAALFSVAYFSHVLNYAYLFVWSVRPSYILIVFLVALFPLLISRPGLRVQITSPLVLWCLGYVAFCSVWYAFFGGGPAEPLVQRIFAGVFLLGAYTLFVQHERIISTVRWTLLFCVLFGVLINAYDITHPFVLIPSSYEYAILGRAAGFYVNPNLSGTALVLGFILTVDLLRVCWRPIYLFVVCVGVLLTGSRAAIGGLVLVILLLSLSGSLRPRQVISVFLVAGFLGVVLMRTFGATLDFLQIDWNVLYQRLEWFTDLGSNADFSQRERVLLAEKAWSLVADHPFLGAGLGSTELWSERTSTHNMYLASMADFGVLGILVFPALVVVSTGGVIRMLDRTRAPFTIFVFWSGMFSHNIIGEYYFMIALSFMAAMIENETPHASGMEMGHGKFRRLGTQTGSARHGMVPGVGP